MKIRSLILFCYAFLLINFINAQINKKNIVEYKVLKKRVYNFTKIDFVTSEVEFNESICTLLIPDLIEDSPPYVAIYYKRDNSEWFTESLYRKRLRFSFKNGVFNNMLFLYAFQCS